MFPETKIVDDFNRANEGPPPSSNWTLLLGVGSRVVSNAVARGSAGSTGDNGSYWNVQDFGPDCEVYATGSAWGASFGDAYCRLVDIGVGTLDGYDFAGNASNSRLVTYRMDNGVFTQLGAFETQALAAGDSWGGEIIGTGLQIYYRSGSGSWTAIGSGRSDSTYPSAGKIGLTFNNDTQSFDNFGGGTKAKPTEVFGQFPKYKLATSFPGVGGSGPA